MKNVNFVVGFGTKEKESCTLQSIVKKKTKTEEDRLTCTRNALQFWQCALKMENRNDIPPTTSFILSKKQEKKEHIFCSILSSGNFLFRVFSLLWKYTP